MTDDELRDEQAVLEREWDQYHRLDEIRTERRRRIISLDGDIGRREPRIST